MHIDVFSRKLNKSDIEMMKGNLEDAALIKNRALHLIVFHSIKTYNIYVYKIYIYMYLTTITVNENGRVIFTYLTVVYQNPFKVLLLDARY